MFVAWLKAAMKNNRSYSLRRRMLISASLVLIVFIVITALILDQAFKRSLQTDLQERLQTQLYLVLGAAEFNEQQLQLPNSLNLPKLNQLDSGSIAFILDGQGHEVWRSGSAQGFAKSAIAPVKTQQPGKKGSGEMSVSGQAFFYASMGVAWEVKTLAHNSPNLKSYTLVTAEHAARFEQSMSQYRMFLWFGLGMLALILLGVFTLTLYWGLSPLKALVHDLNQIESGKATLLTGHYPKELTGLTENLNQLLQHEKRQHTRYHNTLANLAHSLKTPLAVLRGLVDKHRIVQADNQSALGGAHVDSLEQQVTRMNEIVQHQLQRASHVGPQTMQQTLQVLPLLESLSNVIEKVYQESLQCIDIDTAPDVVFKGAKGDLMEIVGNLLDNAAKYGNGIIRLALSNELAPEQDVVQTRCRIIVEDNGQGIKDEAISDILRRGIRADQKQQGQGIGLAMVVDIVDQYQGKLHLGKSALGGLKVEIFI